MKKLAAIAFWIAGIALLIALVAHQGFANIGAALAQVRWGFLGVCAYYPLALLVDTFCWQRLFPSGVKAPAWPLYWSRWICDAINNLLPVAQVGGDIVRARILMRYGVGGAAAGASVVADISSGVVTEIIFSLTGVTLLIHRGGQGDLVLAALLGLGLFTLMIAAFFAAQRFGMFGKVVHLLERMLQGPEWKSVAGAADALDAAILDIYRRRGDFLIASFWRMVGWLLGAVEVYLALYFLGHRVSAAEALMLESMGQALRHAVFFVPGGLGVQEGGFIVLGAAIGLAPQTALALSLVKRVRELTLSLPPLVAWHFYETRRMLRGSK